MNPAPEDRLAPDVRALVDAMTAFFPDLGGAVTDAAEARRVLAASPASPLPPPVVGSVEDRDIPGPAERRGSPYASTARTLTTRPARARPSSSSTGEGG